MTGGLKRKTGKAAPIAEINMIPLIDVSLVLLIIFMVMTPFLVQQQIRVHLPQAVSASEAPDKPIVITVQHEGEISLNGHAIAAGSLEAELRQLLGSSGKAVLIQADRELQLQHVVSIMDVAKRLNVAKLGISVQQPK